ncbi:MAG: DNA-directed RNA polymerase subunit B [Nanoarchaeota archaeon]|nr:DNA-directed RNA polymerase subunit B [Nanoarchaeota archaeon]
MVDVYLNQKFIGTVGSGEKFVQEIRKGRMENKIPSSLNISYDKDFNVVNIDTTRGRVRRPLVVVVNGMPLLTDDMIKKLINKEINWDHLIKQGVIEYLDAMEEEDAYIALSEEDIINKHTHLEISPIVILGLCSSLIPYSNHSGSSRLIRGNKIQKQALGLYTSNYLIRMDTDVNILHYPQVPIVKSFMSDVLNYEKHPAGQNVVIALLSYKGYNMEDAIILNKGSIERGLARSTYFRPDSTEELRYSGGLVDEIGIPDKDVKGYRSEKDYRYLEKDGVVYAGAKVDEDDVLIGKTSPPRFLGGLDEFSIAASTRRESSSVVKHPEKGVVDFVVITDNVEGNKLIQVRLRHQRIPEIGDKFASRHGQKGVIGMIVNEEDVPFSANGIKPDIIFSPHSIPSRMTINHLLEVLAGKVGSLKGEFIDGTTFDSRSEEDLRKDLFELGFKESGTETMYNGITGEQFDVKIFMGNIYYLKLKHMVCNKLHARASGRVQLLTRQPIEGRGKGGGLRLGEMEKDCFVAHGASLLLKERFDSDKTIIYICESCGLLAINDIHRSIKTCPKCAGNVEITAIEMSYAFKLLLDELKSMCIYPKLVLKSKY